MGRRKSIDPQQVLDAAERVVAQVGAARLTLDAVAAEAGVSKASVVYDFQSKAGLIHAVVERAVARDNAFNREAAAGFDQDAVLRGRLAAAAQPFPEAFQPVALALCAAMAQDPQLRAPIQHNQAQILAEIQQQARHPRSAMLAYLALEGMKLLESLDYVQWPPAQRQQLLHDIGALIDTAPR
ncbi:TetR/AcrR family transcriptional regulator [Stenotrophomonas sp. ZAC14D2_NAIMI4_7]|uniref:TetR/AcrR family transcriptional regulator n=1 Tax=Stenotrophomonas sp. ZAC14D2_NAIMI4_7 TaxID=2072405 RepID=UPI000D53EE30|nr:TetR/AcrR family transcriptional regulator [Stenotrophomonas sp. ZAC14D2_NAIMI4_7]AWH19061.1 TetR/AcrR family transcriptional regulator [Stenotrophomonas sp. ZAC14D2_NAIMI4_7]